MSDDGLTSFGATMGPLVARMEAHYAEHERRMREDPEYRAQEEKREAQRAQQEADERRHEANRRRATLNKSRQEKGIPEKFFPFLDAWRSGTTNGPASVENARGWATRLLSEGGDWVFLFLGGPVGVGKTAAAAWFLDAPFTRYEPDPFGGKAGKTVTREAGGRFVTAEALTKASTFAADYWDGLRNAPRLVIDDLGVERLDDKGWAISNLTALLSHRHAHRLPTVITLNMNRRTFEEKYATQDGGRLRDRLRESAWFVDVTGPSLRRPLKLDAVPPNSASGASAKEADPS